MAKISEVIALANSIAPEEYKCGFDNVGLIVGRREADVRRVMVCMDVTNDVLREAIEKEVTLIISHHPMIFGGIKTVSDDTVLGNKIVTAIENGISIYAAHTNLDSVKDGINDFVAELLSLTDLSVIDGYVSESEGIGRVGNLGSKMLAGVLKGQVETVFKDKYVRLIGEPYTLVSRVAIINGGGGGDVEYIDIAKKKGADCLITADVKHHVAVYAKDNGMTVIEPQHYTMEHCYLTRLTQMLKIEAAANKLEVEIFQSQQDINPRF